MHSLSRPTLQVMSIPSCDSFELSGLQNDCMDVIAFTDIANIFGCILLVLARKEKSSSCKNCPACMLAMRLSK